MIPAKKDKQRVDQQEYHKGGIGELFIDCSAEMLLQTVNRNP